MAQSKEYYSLNDCLSYKKFQYYGWESGYTKYAANMIKILDTYNDVCRLYLLLQLDLFRNDADMTINKLKSHKINQYPEAIQLSSSLKDLLPNVDPIYLDLVGEVYMNDYDSMAVFLQEVTMSKKSYPKIQSYNEIVKKLNVIKDLTINFTVDKFLRICPDPEKYFNCIKLNSPDFHYDESATYLAFKYGVNANSLDVYDTLQSNDFSLTKAIYDVENVPDIFSIKIKKKRYYTTPGYYEYRSSTNIEFWKEVAYIEHQDEILNVIKAEKSIYQQKIAEAKANGQLRFCECCFNNELLESDMHCCPAGHYFCSSCIKQGTEVAVGNGKMDVICFAYCDEEIDLSIIKELIDDNMYQHIMRRRQVREIKAAGIEGLETCPFCDFCIILPPDIIRINCLNPECSKESCRKCREESHFPYECDEVVDRIERKVRCMIENKLTDYLTRTCCNCKRTYIKTGGCNHMICVCKQRMCYVCRQPILVGDRAHFNFNGPDDEYDKDKCPLYFDHFGAHENSVDTASKEVIDELKIKKPKWLDLINFDMLVSEIKYGKKNKPNRTNDPFNEPAFTPNELIGILTGDINIFQ